MEILRLMYEHVRAESVARPQQQESRWLILLRFDSSLCVGREHFLLVSGPDIAGFNLGEKYQWRMLCSAEAVVFCFFIYSV